MNWCWVGQDGLDCCGVSVDVVCAIGRSGVPSNIPRPDRKIGTNEIVPGVMSVVPYSNPKCVLP